MGQKRDVTILQAKGIGRCPRLFALSNLNDFAFTKVVSTAIGSKLSHFVRKIRHVPLPQERVQSRFQRGLGVVMADVK